MKLFLILLAMTIPSAQGAQEPLDELIHIRKKCFKQCREAHYNRLGDIFIIIDSLPDGEWGSSLRRRGRESMALWTECDKECQRQMHLASLNYQR